MGEGEGVKVEPLSLEDELLVLEIFLVGTVGFSLVELFGDEVDIERMANGV